MDNTKITVVFGTYKEPKLITPSIESLLNSSYKEFKAIVVDDNSPDDYEISLEVKRIVESYNDERISLIKNDINIGVPFVFKKWIDLVETEYFLITGAGDIFDTMAIEEYVKFLDKHPSASFVFAKERFQGIDGNFSELKREEIETGVYEPYKYLEFHLIGGKGNYGWSQASAMYRTEFFKVKNIPVTPYHYWDHYFHMKYLLFSNKVGHINKYLAIRHVEPSLKVWADQNIFVNKVETIYQSYKFINEFETILVSKRYPITRYRIFIIKNLLKQFLKLENIEELFLCSNIFLSLFSKVFMSSLIILILSPIKLVGYLYFIVRNTYAQKYSDSA